MQVRQQALPTSLSPPCEGFFMANAVASSRHINFC